MKRGLFAASVGLLLALAASAQSVPATASLTASDTGACTTTGACLAATPRPTSNAGSAVIQVTGTFSATLQFEGSTTSGGTFVAVNATPIGSATSVNSTTAVGAWRVNVAGLGAIRVRCSTYSSGTAVVTITLSNASAANTTLGGAPVFAQGSPGTSQANSAQNAINYGLVAMPPTGPFGNIVVHIGTADGSVNSSWGIYSLSGTTATHVCTITAATFSGTGLTATACSEGTVPGVAGGTYIFGFCSNNATPTLKLDYAVANVLVPFSSATSATACTAGQMPATFQVASAGQVETSYGQPEVGVR